MNTLVKLFIVFAVIVGVLTLLTTLIPDTLTGNVDHAIIFFLSYINNLAPLIHVATAFQIIRVMLNFVAGLVTLTFVIWAGEKALQ